MGRRGGGCVLGQNMCLRGALCSIPINLIWNMSTFREKNVLTFDLTPGVDGACKDMNVTCLVCYFLICL